MAWSTPATWSTSQVVTAAEMNQEVRDNLTAVFPDDAAGVAWSPTLEAVTTNPTTSSVTGVEYRIGAIQFCWARWVISTNGSGAYFVTLPNTASGITASTSAGSGQRIGGFMVRDITPAYMAEGAVLLRSSTTAHFHSTSETGGTDSGILSHDNPRTWATSDVLSFYAQYPIA